MSTTLTDVALTDIALTDVPRLTRCLPKTRTGYPMLTVTGWLTSTNRTLGMPRTNLIRCLRCPEVRVRLSVSARMMVRVRVKVRVRAKVRIRVS